MKLLTIRTLILIVVVYLIANGAAPRSLDNTQSGVIANLQTEQRTGSELIPDLDLKQVSGRRFHLKDLRGRVVLLNFWATWCVPCRVEIPDFNKLSDEFRDQGLAVVGVSWDDTEKQIAGFRKRMKLNYQIVLGGESIEAKFGGVPSIPTTYIIDRTGRIRQKIVGVTERPEIEAVIKSLLAERS